jgi:hypothetical protein
VTFAAAHHRQNTSTVCSASEHRVTLLSLIVYKGLNPTVLFFNMLYDFNYYIQ